MFSLYRISAVIKRIIIMKVAVLATGTTSRLVFLCAGSLVSTMMHAADGALPPKSLIEEALLQKDLPDTGEQWMTMPNGMEYQPAADLSPLAQRHLRQLTSEDTSMGAFEKIFADGTETYYDEYAQAWRALGFYIDCDYQDEGRRRSLEDAGDDESAGCSRFMLWAAYVDEDYSGNGVGEYMYYNRKANGWDQDACTYDASSRCVKMDCHLPDTHFTLLGFFKEPNYDEWMEQLFKHEGDCVWTDEEYQFMQGNREVWPQGCTNTWFGLPVEEDGMSNSSGYFHYDIKPSKYGEMSIGLYTDSSCIVEYTGKLVDAETLMYHMVCSGQAEGGDDGEALCSTNKTSYNDAYDTVMATYYNNGDDDAAGAQPDRRRGNLWELMSEMEQWNRAFDVFKQCQPCKTYDITHFVAGKGYVANSQGDRYNWTSAASDKEDDHNDDEDDGDVFHCHDDAGYDDVNQCMKFKTKTRMMTASWRDVEMAGAQGSITAVQLPGLEGTFQYSSKVVYGGGLNRKMADSMSYGVSWALLVLSCTLFGASSYRLFKISKDESHSVNEPLVPFNGVEPLVVRSEGVVA